MYLCYIDESGTHDIPGNTSHYVLVGLSIPIDKWRTCESEIEEIKHKFAIQDGEIHVGWLLRPYVEQKKISNFQALDRGQRRTQVESLRKAEILRLQKTRKREHLKQTRKNHKNTAQYIHLTLNERRQLVMEIAARISGWGFARLFAECIDKVHFDPNRASYTVDEQAFEQVVSRFEQFLRNVERSQPSSTSEYGLLIHDNNPTVAKRHTDLMKRFHAEGTLWTQVNHIIETPLFVDSQLTSMVQLADLCAYALRRYLENQEDALFDKVFSRADRVGSITVGVRHFTNTTPPCVCKICLAHRRTTLTL